LSAVVASLDRVSTDRQPTIVVVGAGISGAACAAALTAAGLRCTVVERGRAPGGRLASPELHGRRTDLGAAYFTVSDPAFEATVASWADRGLAGIWTDTFAVFDVCGPGAPKSGPPRWSAPGGLRTLVRDLMPDGLAQLSHPVRQVGHDGIRPVIDGVPTDIVVLAMPDPQSVRLLTAPDGGGAAAAGTAAEAAIAAAREVSYAPVLALSAGWDSRWWPFQHGAFLNDRAAVTFVADDGARRGDDAAVLVLHSTPELATEYLHDPSSAAAPMLAALFDAVATDGSAPEWTDVHRWTFAKPTGTHAAAPYFFADGLALVGDSWCPSGSPRVESAWLSGTRLGQAIAASIG
jgi:renalase